jgi:SAM-dependent MidA family methyltransferase
MAVSIGKTLKRITENPWLNVLVGLIFLVTGTMEMFDAMEEAEGFVLGVHHGAMAYGLLHALKYLPNLFEGLEYVQRETPDR